MFKLNVRPKQNWITGPPPGCDPYPKLEELQEQKSDKGEAMGEGEDNDDNDDDIALEMLIDTEEQMTNY